MSKPVEKPNDWYEVNQFNEANVLQAAINIISGKYDLPNSGNAHGRARYRNDSHYRFYGALPGMFASRGMDILPDQGLSIKQMVANGLLDVDVLRKLETSYRSDYIIYQERGYVEFAYHKDYPVVPDSGSLTLREQMKVVEDHCRDVMGSTTGIFPGVHSLRDTLAFVLAYRSVHGKYPIEDGRVIRTFDLLKTEGQDDIHPTVGVIGEGSWEKLDVQVKKADAPNFGVEAAFFWLPSQ